MPKDTGRNLIRAARDITAVRGDVSRVLDAFAAKVRDAIATLPIADVQRVPLDDVQTDATQLAQLLRIEHENPSSWAVEVAVRAAAVKNGLSEVASGINDAGAVDTALDRLLPTALRSMLESMSVTMARPAKLEQDNRDLREQLDALTKQIQSSERQATASAREKEQVARKLGQARAEHAETTKDLVTTQEDLVKTRERLNATEKRVYRMVALLVLLILSLVAAFMWCFLYEK